MTTLNTQAEEWFAQVVWKTESGELRGRYAKEGAPREQAAAKAKVMKKVALAQGLNVVDCSIHCQQV